MASQAAHAGGNITLGERTLYVRVLGVQQERALWNELSRALTAKLGPGGLFQRMAPRLDWLKQEKRHVEFAAVVARITEMEANQEPIGGVESFRATADGVAIELFYRTRQTSAEVGMEAIKAVVNDLNAVEVHLAILSAITPPEPDEKKG